MLIGYLMQNGVPDLQKISGPAIHVRRVVENLQQRDHQVRVIYRNGRDILWSDDLRRFHEFDQGITQSAIFKLSESGVRRIQREFRIPYIALFDSIRFAEASWKLLHGFDILYERCGYMSYGGVLVSRYLKIPLVLEVNGDHFEEMDNLKIRPSQAQRIISSKIVPRTMKAATAIVAPGYDLARRLDERWQINTEKVHVIFNGTDIAQYGAQYEPHIIRQHDKLGKGPVIIYVGGFQPWQGVDVLIEALARVLTVFPDAQLVLIGDGPERDNVLALSKRLNVDTAVHALGWREQKEVAAVLSIADVAVAPYRDWVEMVGMKILDYMAMGMAIIASSRETGHAFLEHEHTGLLVEPGQIEALASAIVRLLQDGSLRNRLGKAAKWEAMKHYTWAHTVEKIENLCYGLIAKAND